MRIIEGLKSIALDGRKIALSIGNFEGFHLGHRTIVDTLKNEAAKQELLTCIITFKNHPLQLLKGFEPERLWSRCEKIKTFYREGIDILIYLSFSKEFASQDPEEFLHIIEKKINPSLVCLGESFRFGKENKGNIKTIEEYGKKHGWRVFSIKELEMFGVKVSSTIVRRKIKEGDFNTANAMLGRKYSLYLEPVDIKKRLLKLFIENMAVPHSGIYRGEMIDLKRKDYYATTVKFEDGFAEIADKRIIIKDSLYSFSFDSNRVE